MSQNTGKQMTTVDDHANGATMNITKTQVMSKTLANGQVSNLTTKRGGAQARFPDGSYTTTDGSY